MWQLNHYYHLAYFMSVPVTCYTAHGTDKVSSSQ